MKFETSPESGSDHGHVTAHFHIHIDDGPGTHRPHTPMLGPKPLKTSRKLERYVVHEHK